MPNNLFEKIRMQNIFGQPPIMGNDLPSQGGISGQMNPNQDYTLPNFQTGQWDLRTPQQPQPMFGQNVDFSNPTNYPQDADPSMMDMMRQYYQPETAATDAYNKHLGEYPERPNLNKWQKGLKVIGATLADWSRRKTGGGGEAGMAVMEGARGPKLRDWKEKLPGYQQAAQFERYANANERQAAYQAASAQTAANRQKAQETNWKNIDESRRIRNELAKLKYDNPDVQFDFSGPTVKYGNKRTGVVTDTHVPTGKMTDEDKINLQGDIRMEGIREAGKEARTTEETRQGNRMDLARLTGAGTGGVFVVPDENGNPISVTVNPRTNQYTPITTGGPQNNNIPGVSRPGSGRQVFVTPIQQKTEEGRRAREIINTNPELGQWIKQDGNGDFRVDPPDNGWGSGPSQEQYDQIRRMIYGQSRSNMPGIPMGRSNQSKRERAIQQLREAGKPITDRNIAYVEGKLKD